jgi:hypothetical protein
MMCDQGRLGGPNNDFTKSGFGNNFHRLEKEYPNFKSTGTKKLDDGLVNQSIDRLKKAALFKVSRTFVHNVWKVSDECTNILIKKQEDYGPHNIGQAPGGALNGLIVRIHDKISRIKHLTESKVEPNNESLRDSYIDLANYALIALMVLDGTWPKE